VMQCIGEQSCHFVTSVGFREGIDAGDVSPPVGPLFLQSDQIGIRGGTKREEALELPPVT